MASAVAARKKSIASAGGVLQIDIPVAATTILNKTAAQATSLYQQCVILRERLMRIHDFPPFLALASHARSRQSTDPVNLLWACLSLGIPLCFLFNLLPPPAPRIVVNTDPDDIDLDPENSKGRQRATALFITNIIKLQKSGDWDDGDVFTVGDLVSPECNTSGFTKVVRAVGILLDRLPEHVFVANPMPSSPPSTHESPTASNRPRLDSDASTPFPPVAANAQEAERKNIIRELLETERKYVGELEIMQQFASQLGQRGVMDSDTIHHMFPNLHALLDFQQRFLIRMEQTAELPWMQQQWGRLFSENEDGFAVYEPYCAHYSNAADLVLMEETTLNGFVAVISTSELPAFLIKPVQRICKYPLLLESLIKAVKATDYPYLAELREGLATTKRVADKINEAQRRAENKYTVKALESRVEDWKGHHLNNFGELLLDDVFIVTKSDVDREYHVFLFEKIILCCKEVPAYNPRKVGKSPSLLKKQAVLSQSQSSGGGAAARKRTTPLLLKGRIFLNNVTVAQPANKAGQWSLQVWWKGDDDLEYFTLRCRTEEQLRMWETTITRLVADILAKRQAEKTSGNSTFPRPSNSTNPALPPSLPVGPQHDRNMSYTSSYYSTTGPNAGPSMTGRSRFMSYTDDSSSFTAVDGAYSYSSRNSSKDGWDDDEIESDYQHSSYSASGRGTPVGVGRRAAAAKSMPPEREAPPGAEHDRSRARTEDFGGTVLREWKSRPPQPAPTSALPPTPANRPGVPRGMSTASNTSVGTNASDASFGNLVRPGLRSQFSSTKLRSTYEASDNAASSRGTNGSAVPPLPQTRSRSASQPSQPSFMPKQVPPPLPNNGGRWTRGQNGTGEPYTNGNGKRESGSSQSTGTGGSSDYSPPHTMSPVTPYGSGDSTASIRQQRSQIFQPGGPSRAPGFALLPPIKVKVHYGEDLFVIVVPRSTPFDDLVEKVGKKIRLCGPRRDDLPLRVKYRDEDGDLVSLASNEDVQLAFESQQVTLYVA